MKLEAMTPRKKPYQPPRLQVYGHLTEMTKTGGSGKSDKGMSTTQLT
jgi:hypothetical protein